MKIVTIKRDVAGAGFGSCNFNDYISIEMNDKLVKVEVAGNGDMIKHKPKALSLKSPLLIYIDRKVYDVTKFQHDHPGGRLPLVKMMDKDCTALFHAVGHSKFAMNLLQKHLVKEQDMVHDAHTTVHAHSHAFEWHKFAVFLLGIIAVPYIIYAYWKLICNNHHSGDDGIETLQDLIQLVIPSIYLPTQASLGSLFLADYLLVPQCSMNFQMLEQVGYPLYYTTALLGLYYIISGPTLGIVLWIFCQDSQPYFSVWLVVKVISVYLLSDITFEYVHKWMHYKKPEWHMMHHVIIFPTACAGFLLEIHDYIMELWVGKIPILIIFGTDLFNAYDGFACVLCLALTLLNNTIGHDSWLLSAHYLHHLSSGSTFGTLPFRITFPFSQQCHDKKFWDHPLRNSLESLFLLTDSSKEL